MLAVETCNLFGIWAIRFRVAFLLAVEALHYALLALLLGIWAVSLAVAFLLAVKALHNSLFASFSRFSRLFGFRTVSS